MILDIVTLLTVNTQVSETGDPIDEVISTRDVYCRVVSANDREKTLAATRGESAELVVIMPDRIDYNEELYLLYNGVKYRVTDTRISDTSNEIRLVITKWQTQ